MAETLGVSYDSVRFRNKAVDKIREFLYKVIYAPCSFLMLIQKIIKRGFHCAL